MKMRSAGHGLQTLLRLGFALLLAAVFVLPVQAQNRPTPEAVLQTWYGLILELVRHTATYSPPVASRSFGYLGVTTFEALASNPDSGLVTLSGQVNALLPAPDREAGMAYDDALVLHAALTVSANAFFGNTGPSGQNAMTKTAARMDMLLAEGLAPDVAARSTAYGKAVAQHILDWSASDGGAVIENMGFPYAYQSENGPAYWVPTSKIAVQQTPLLPNWGNNRPFAMPDGAACPLPPPHDYSEDAGSPFHDEAMVVYNTSKSLTDEQKLIARFWSDDPMLSPTPPGHWISIALALLKTQNADAPRYAEVLAKLGMGVADGFIGCWNAKFTHDLLRPVTYINRVIDPAWQPLLITPPFPEYPSGHASQSGAAATVLTDLFGDNIAFDDATHEAEGLPTRHFTSFWQAAEEAAVSRLYGGIHFPNGNKSGLEQGRCIGAHINKIRTKG